MEVRRTCHTTVCHNVASCQVLVERSDDQLAVNIPAVALEGIVLYAIVLLLMRLPVMDLIIDFMSLERLGAVPHLTSTPLLRRPAECLPARSKTDLSCSNLICAVQR